MQYIQFFLEHWILSSAFIIVLAVLIWYEYKGKAMGASRIAPAQAVQLINKQNAQVIDVREKGAYNAGHIVNAMHATKDEIQDAAPKLQKFKNQPVLLVCASGTSSSTLATQMHKQGFTQVYFLQGGLNAWKAESLPVVKG